MIVDYDASKYSDKAIVATFTALASRNLLEEFDERVAIIAESPGWKEYCECKAKAARQLWAKLINEREK